MRHRFFDLGWTFLIALSISCSFTENLSADEIKNESALSILNEFSIYHNLSIKKLVNEYLAKKEYLNQTELCALMTSFGSDKGSNWHNYSSLYFKLFSPCKNEKLNIFELGIGTNNVDVAWNMGLHGHPGASLHAWAAFFPNGKVFGADVDSRILFHTDRIKTYYCDQFKSKTIVQMFSNDDLNDIQFDIMLEDGFHSFAANKIFLLNSMSKLKKGGVYIVEDLNQRCALAFKKILASLKKEFSLRYINVVSIPLEGNKVDNTLLIIQK